MKKFFKGMDGDDKVMMVLILGITAMFIAIILGITAMVIVYLVCDPSAHAEIAAITGNF